MQTSESEYPLPPDSPINYDDSWRPEDKAIESAERELASEHPDLHKTSDDHKKIETDFKDKDV